MDLLKSMLSEPEPTWKADAKKLALELGTHIPGYIDEKAWALPILKALLARIEELEKK